MGKEIFVVILLYSILKVKPSSEQSFLYGNHILKSGLGRITEGAAQYQGVVVYNMNDVPLGKLERSQLHGVNRTKCTS